MPNDLPERMNEVLLAGLNLRDRIARGDRPHLATEQAKLKALLRSGDEPSPWAGGVSAFAMQSVGAGSEAVQGFLGMRYAFVCWLDEILIEAGWREWDENKLEQALYRTNIRYRNFWTQAKLAETAGLGHEASAAYLYCVWLGFQGEMSEAPEKLRDWTIAARSRVTRQMGREPTAIPQRAPVCDVPLLEGLDAYKRMTGRLTVVLLFAVPIAAFLVIVGFLRT